MIRLHGNTITNHFKEYSSGGLAAVVEHRYYRPSSCLEPFLACLTCLLRAAPVADAAHAVARIESLTGIRLSESQARRFMKRLGMKVRKTGSTPAKADGQMQFEFYTTQMLPRLEAAGKAERKVFFVDAAHFVPGAFLGMIRCFAGILIRTSPERQRYSVLGAVDSHSHELISIRTRENINATSVVEHAAQLDVELLFLPACSPNLIERMWELT